MFYFRLFLATTALACLIALTSESPRASAPFDTWAHIRLLLAVFAFFVCFSLSEGFHGIVFASIEKFHLAHDFFPSCLNVRREAVTTP